MMGRHYKRGGRHYRPGHASTNVPVESLHPMVVRSYKQVRSRQYKRVRPQAVQAGAVGTTSRQVRRDEHCQP